MPHEDVVVDRCQTDRSDCLRKSEKEAVGRAEALLMQGGNERLNVQGEAGLIDAQVVG